MLKLEIENSFIKFLVDGENSRSICSIFNSHNSTDLQLRELEFQRQIKLEKLRLEQEERTRVEQLERKERMQKEKKCNRKRKNSNGERKIRNGRANSK